MTRIIAAVLLLAGIWLLPTQATPDETVAEARAAELIAWIGDNTEFDVSHVSVPKIVQISQDEIASLLGFEADNGPNRPIAAYRVGVVLLPPEFQIGRHDWMLLHELVHHVQHETGATYACKAERERVAYELQVKFAHDRGGRIPNDLFVLYLDCGPYY